MRHLKLGVRKTILEKSILHSQGASYTGMVYTVKQQTLWEFNTYKCEKRSFWQNFVLCALLNKYQVLSDFILHR
jgi:hypothetical protein